MRELFLRNPKWNFNSKQNKLNKATIKVVFIMKSTL